VVGTNGAAGSKRRTTRDGEDKAVKRRKPRELEEDPCPQPIPASQEREIRPTCRTVREILGKRVQHQPAPIQYIQEGGCYYRIIGDVAVIAKPAEATTKHNISMTSEPSLGSAPFPMRAEEEGDANLWESKKDIEILKCVLDNVVGDTTNAGQWWNGIHEAIKEVAGGKKGQPLAHEYLKYLGGLAESNVFLNWPKLHALPESNSRTGTEGGLRKILWAAGDSGLMHVATVPRGTAICYPANFWRTGDRSLVQARDELWICVHAKPDPEELRRLRRENTLDQEMLQESGSKDSIISAAIQGDITHSRKGRAMAVGFVYTAQQGTIRESGSMQVHGRCSIIRAYMIAICQLMQSIQNQSELRHYDHIQISYHCTRLHRYLSDNLRLDVMQYEDELMQDLYERMQALFLQFQRQNTQISLQQATKQQGLIQEVIERTKEARHAFRPEWERTKLDRDISFAIEEEDTFRPGLDRLKRWDQIIREEELGTRQRRGGVLTLTEQFLLERDAGRKWLAAALQRADAQEALSVGQDNLASVSLV